MVMIKNRVLLHVQRYKCKGANECTIAAATSLASFYDESLTYAKVRKHIPPRQRLQGLWTSQWARLLNKLGFGKVTIVTADLDYMDFGWAKLPQEALVDKLKKMRTYYGRAREQGLKRFVQDIIKWLETEDCDNQLRIDQDFPKWIKLYLDNGRPVGATFNQTSLHKLSKYRKGGEDDIRGETEDHAVVIRGYDDNGIFVVDSDTYKWKKYRNGYYKIPWHRFLVNAPIGDLILVG